MEIEKPRKFFHFIDTGSSKAHCLLFKENLKGLWKLFYTEFNPRNKIHTESHLNFSNLLEEKLQSIISTYIKEVNFLKGTSFSG